MTPGGAPMTGDIASWAGYGVVLSVFGTLLAAAQREESGTSAVPIWKVWVWLIPVVRRRRAERRALQDARAAVVPCGEIVGDDPGEVSYTSFAQRCQRPRGHGDPCAETRDPAEWEALDPPKSSAPYWIAVGALILLPPLGQWLAGGWS